MFNEVDITSAPGFSNSPIGFPGIASGVGVSPSHYLPNEDHARQRLADRYGLDLTAELRALILGLIARASNGRHPRACRIAFQIGHRELWRVSASGTILDVVVRFKPGRAPSIVTFLQPRWWRA